MDVLCLWRHDSGLVARTLARISVVHEILLRTVLTTVQVRLRFPGRDFRSRRKFSRMIWFSSPTGGSGQVGSPCARTTTGSWMLRSYNRQTPHNRNNHRYPQPLPETPATQSTT